MAQLIKSLKSKKIHKYFGNCRIIEIQTDSKRTHRELFKNVPILFKQAQETISVQPNLTSLRIYLVKPNQNFE